MSRSHRPGFADAPSWVRWIAQDPDGSWWGFEAEPMAADYGWYENEIGRYTRLAEDAVNAHWCHTLRRVDRDTEQDRAEFTSVTS